MYDLLIFMYYSIVDSKGRAKCNCTKFYTGKECKDCACKNGGGCVLTDKTVSCR